METWQTFIMAILKIQHLGKQALQTVGTMEDLQKFSMEDNENCEGRSETAATRNTNVNLKPCKATDRWNLSYI